MVGTPESTASNISTSWVVTLLHEHFHQLQYSQKGYYTDVSALGLAKGDQTGMWMLNFPFPYQVPEIATLIAGLCRQCVEMWQVQDDRVFQEKLALYLVARKQLQQALKPDDYKYLSFQLWQEGIARYTEFHVATWAAEHYKPSQEFASLPDFSSFQDTAKTIQQRMLTELTTADLRRDKRVLFYPLGAAEGLLLDRLDKNWHRRYFREKFDIGPYFEKK